MQLWPQGRWFGLTRRRIRKLVVAGLVLTSLVVFMFGSALAYVRYRAHRAQQLVEQLQRLEVGQPPPAELMQLMRRYEPPTRFWTDEPCTEKNCEYAAYISTFGISNFEGTPVDPESLIGSFLGVFDGLDDERMNYLGIRYWVVGVFVRMERGQTKAFSMFVQVEGPRHKWLLADVNMPASTPDSTVRTDAPPGHDVSTCGLHSHWTHLHVGDETGEGVRGQLTAHATPNERVEAFGVRWQCLTGLGGCFELSELAPGLASRIRRSCETAQK